MSTDCTQIFFPSDQQNEEGYIIGFNTRGFNFTILQIINNKSIEEIENQLNNWDKQERIQLICGTKLQVLGIVGKKSDQQFRETWLWLKNNKLEELMICGYKYQTKCTIVYYDKLIQNQIISNEIDNYLDPNHKSILTINPMIAFDQNHSEEITKICDKDKLNELDYSLIHINWRQHILREFNKYINNKSNSEQNYYYCYLKNDTINTLLKIILKITYFQKIVFQFVIKIMEFRIMGKNLQDFGFLSYTMKQVNFKYNLFNQWNDQAGELVSQHQPLFISNLKYNYHKLFSGILFVFLDILFGVLSLLLLYYNVTQLRDFLHKYGSSIHIEVLSKEVEWLMGFPAGLKTNKPLNYVLGQMIMYIIVLWNHITTFITPYENILLRAVMIFGLFGLNFELSLAIDIISLCTIHVYYIYKMLMVIYRQLWVMIICFYRITQNKYINKYRNKLEDHPFLWDQKIISMFLGFFLLMMIPTVSLYYFWFLLIVIFIYLVKLSLISFQRIFSKFPLFLLCSYLYLHNIPQILEMNIQQIQNNTVIVKMIYKKVKITQVIKLNKLLTLKQQFNIAQIIKSIFVGQDIMIKSKTQKTIIKQIKHNVDYLVQL
ncbi:unnamed protein product [Paramecium pentaurelia]|uniref:Uncharacterized protein n=1 Tax=Paramecium pentaurelia TaxID=43138 RepID=A0A8S1T523_9CILI|nr:unnamed protein product [Paramecium pentaurelia]